jgi:hypothetical protein
MPRVAARRGLPTFIAPASWPRRGRVRFIEVPDRRCLAVEGRGEPGGDDFQAAVTALFATAYPLSYLLREHGVETRVAPLEALWERTDASPAWQPGEAVPFEPRTWRWTLLVELPAAATDEEIASAMAVARRRHPNPALARLEVMTVRGGRAVEAMHVGPYDAEPATLERMVALAHDAGMDVKGPHHEIYLGDPRRAKPERLRTVLRLALA